MYICQEHTNTHAHTQKFCRHSCLKNTDQGCWKGYPKGFIHKYVCPQPDRQTTRDCETYGFVTISYICWLSKSIHRVLPPLAIQVTFRPFTTLRQDQCIPRIQYQQTTSRDKYIVSHVLNVSACTYIGQMGRFLDHNLLKNEDLGTSALAEHVFSLNNRVDLSKAMVIGTQSHT